LINKIIYDLIWEFRVQCKNKDEMILLYDNGVNNGRCT